MYGISHIMTFKDTNYSQSAILHPSAFIYITLHGKIGKRAEFQESINRHLTRRTLLFCYCLLTCHAGRNRLWKVSGISTPDDSTSAACSWIPWCGWGQTRWPSHQGNLENFETFTSRTSALYTPLGWINTCRHSVLTGACKSEDYWSTLKYDDISYYTNNIAACIICEWPAYHWRTPSCKATKLDSTGLTFSVQLS